jgi:hypothetical protein
MAKELFKKVGSTGFVLSLIAKPCKIVELQAYYDYSIFGANEEGNCGNSNNFKT